MTKKQKNISCPCKNPEPIRSLRCGDEVLLSGTIFTGRDAFHKKLSSLEKAPYFLLPGSAIYHCGPIAKNEGGNFKIIAAGPTTSWRMGLYAPEIIKRFHVKIFIGKGGMNQKFAEACVKHGAVYLSFPGGCAQSACKYFSEIRNVYYLNEFGPAEAVYEISVKNMPLTVTIDSHGGNLHEKIKNTSLKKISS
ncbi:MAG TPA: FumA C-terminus/TtdB family hydratase beta subunit [Victivallales bacterium]|nr:FumA C-terminus/TtdB family hydratase beta subunit [Victivallales bacterium]